MMEAVRYEDVTEEQWLALADCLWGRPADERYSCDSADEAIGEVLECAPEADGFDVVAMRPVSLPDDVMEWKFDTVVESLDEDYGDPDGDRWETTDRVAAAWQALCDAIKADYTPWICEEVFRVRVDAAAWDRKRLARP